jgi:ribosomal protein S18 acetylase RimI-like enzyme
MNDARLDNVIWTALTTVQGVFGERDGDAARFLPDVTGLAGLRVFERTALESLGRLLKPGERTGLFLDQPLDWLPPTVARVDGAPLAQMVFVGDAREARIADGIVELGVADRPEMLALAQATRPGPFGTRTAELGTFLGIREGGRLIAMAGQRMRLPGRAEISAVCTDPAHLGKGHAARLMIAQLALLREAALLPAFLHVKAENTRAFGLYERLGFVIRRRCDYHVLEGR